MIQLFVWSDADLRTILDDPDVSVASPIVPGETLGRCKPLPDVALRLPLPSPLRPGTNHINAASIHINTQSIHNHHPNPNPKLYSN